MPMDVTKGKLLPGPPALPIPTWLLLEHQMGFNRDRRRVIIKRHLVLDERRLSRVYFQLITLCPSITPFI